jgi:Ca2+-binding RTX toxin-like protein
MRRWISVIAVAVLVSLLAVAPLPTLAGAQDESPEPRASTVDAVRAFTALASQKSRLTVDDLDALGPNPFLSLTPDRDPAEVVLWRMLAQSIQQRSVDAKAPVGPMIRHREAEPRGTEGRNDIIRRGERIRGFGSAPGETRQALIRGSLVSPNPGGSAGPVVGASVEDDGAIPLANEVPIVRGSFVRVEGEVGDGPNAATGDFDFFSLGAVAAGETIVVDVDTSAVASPTDSFVVIFDSNGFPIDGNDDAGGSVDSYVATTAPYADTFYVMVTGCCGFPFDPFDPASGEGPVVPGGYQVDLGVGVEIDAGDADVFLVDLEAGDALVASVVGAPAQVEIADPARRLVMGSGQNVSFIYPADSPLRHQGHIGADHIASRSGRHSVKVFGGSGGSYQILLRVVPAARRDRPGTDTQTFFLDFDGATVDTSVFGGLLTQARLSPMRPFLFRWGLAARHQDAVIDATVASFRENIVRDLGSIGRNGARAITGAGGQFDVVVLNSRDHADPGDAAGVTRIVIGGSAIESGIPTIGIAQSIDVGNFDRSETALVLLDFLSARRGEGGLNDIRLGPNASKVDLVGEALGSVAAHEAGHLLGNWHTDTFNRRPAIMDAGGDLFAFVGVGPDGRFGSRDDIDVDFRADVFLPDEGFRGREDSVNRTAFALSTGATPITPVCTIVGTDGDDVLTGGPGNDIICGLGGNDVIDGRGGRDRLVGGPGDDVLRGGSGDDIVLGEGGDDRLFGDEGRDWLDGGDGTDRAVGGSGTDQCLAESTRGCERP